MLDITRNNQLSFIVVGFLWLWLTSGRVVAFTFKKLGITVPKAPDQETLKQDKLYGKIFGKCENVIIYILVLLEGYTALALIFAGKTIVRNEDKDKVSSVYHLAGTMINTAYSILIAFIIKYLIGKIEVLK